MDSIAATIAAASSGLFAQSQRIRVASENIANADSTGDTPGANPYTRRVISFASELDNATGANLVTVSDPELDTAPYRIERIPGHPAADRAGNVKLPNVNLLVELSDIREGTRSYDANVQVIKQAHDLVTATLDLLKASS
jgi:flagellar basal-body rod protein FlgC